MLRLAVELSKSLLSLGGREKKKHAHSLPVWFTTMASFYSSNIVECSNVVVLRRLVKPEEGGVRSSTRLAIDCGEQHILLVLLRFALRFVLCEKNRISWMTSLSLI